MSKLIGDVPAENMLGMYIDLSAKLRSGAITAEQFDKFLKGQTKANALGKQKELTVIELLIRLRIRGVVLLDDLVFRTLPQEQKKAINSRDKNPVFSKLYKVRTKRSGKLFLEFYPNKNNPYYLIGVNYPSATLDLKVCVKPSDLNNTWATFFYIRGSRGEEYFGKLRQFLYERSGDEVGGGCIDIVQTY